MKLQFTNGYRPRFDQISRIMQYLLGQEGKKKILRKEIINALGIPDKQIENLTSMMTGFGLVNPRISTLTPFGRTVIQKDPYFEQGETLWMIHYIVSSNPDWVVWYRIINTVIPSLDHYDIAQISKQFFSDLSDFFTPKTITEKLPKEVGAVFAAYTRSQLSLLRLVTEQNTGDFIRSNAIEVPPYVLLFCLLHFRDQFSPGSTALTTRDICSTQNSPGKVLHMPEYQVKILLENLHNEDLIRMEQFANLDQIRIPNSTKMDGVLRMIYGDKNA